jgi:F-type H+-transporting ATPase subunit epsilon
MSRSFKVGIYSSEKVLYEGQASSLIVPCQSGYLGILADHAPLAGRLAAGKITLRQPEGKVSVIDSSPEGFIEVLKNQATILL